LPNSQFSAGCSVMLIRMVKIKVHVHFGFLMHAENGHIYVDSTKIVQAVRAFAVYRRLCKNRNSYN